MVATKLRLAEKKKENPTVEKTDPVMKLIECDPVSYLKQRYPNSRMVKKKLAYKHFQNIAKITHLLDSDDRLRRLLSDGVLRTSHVSDAFREGLTVEAFLVEAAIAIAVHFEFGIAAKNCTRDDDEVNVFSVTADVFTHRYSTDEQLRKSESAAL